MMIKGTQELKKASAPLLLGYKFLNNWWKDLSVSKKLYAVVGLMAILIASELFTLFFAMTTLSSVRAFVAGEGLWSKSQKDAIHSLYQYALHGEERFYTSFKKYLAVPVGDHLARMELSKRPYDYGKVRDGFLQADNHPDDVDGMIKLLVRFHWISYIDEAIKSWSKADLLLDEIVIVAQELHRTVLSQGRKSPKVGRLLKRVSDINTELTREETRFSSTLGAGSRWLENLLMTILVLTVMTIEGTGLFLTFRFGRNLSDSLRKLTQVAGAVGEGKFSEFAPVTSKDELGQLAEALNKMINDLKANATERIHTEEILRKSEERFRVFVEAVGDYAIYMLDANGFVTAWNSGAEKIKKYSAKEILGKHFSFFYTPEDITNRVPERELEIAKVNGRFEQDCIRVRKDGSRFWANVILTALYNHSGKLAGFSKVTRDITERKETEAKLQHLNEDLERRVEERTRELRRRELELSLITNAAPVLLAHLDRNEHFRFANEAFCRWLGINKSDVPGKSYRELVGEDRYLVNKPYVQLVLKGELVSFERMSQTGDLVGIYNVTFVPELDDSKAVVGFILVATDITKHKEIEAELKLAKEIADAANATKSTFLANMSHEIRTPLGAILGFSELLANDEMVTAQRLEASKVIKRNGQLLSNIINDILDLSKVEADKLDIEKMNVPFQEVVTDVEALLNLRATEKGVKLTVKSEGIIPNVIYTDSLRLRQILLNIIGNAIKFTEKGSVEVTIRLVPAENGSTRLAFAIKDSGNGIRPDQVDKIFAPFSQADPSTTRKFGGTGLGLILSKKLANALGGDVVLKESSSDGSTFLVTIDPGTPETVHFQNFEKRPSETVTVKAKGPRIDQLKILLVDDSLDNQTIVDFYLKSAGAFVETASNGKEGLEKAVSGDFGVVLMDLQMPVMDGYEALKELRRLGYTKPVIALTAHAMKEDRKRCLESGFDDHLSKPIDRTALLKAVSQYL